MVKSSPALTPVKLKLPFASVETAILGLDFNATVAPTIGLPSLSLTTPFIAFCNSIPSEETGIKLAPFAKGIKLLAQQSNVADSGRHLRPLNIPRLISLYN